MTLHIEAYMDNSCTISKAVHTHFIHTTKINSKKEIVKKYLHLPMKKKNKDVHILFFVIVLYLKSNRSREY